MTAICNDTSGDIEDKKNAAICELIENIKLVCSLIAKMPDRKHHNSKNE